MNLLKYFFLLPFLIGCEKDLTTSSTPITNTPVSKFDITTIENEPLFNKSWHINSNNTYLQPAYTEYILSDADINIKEAWKSTAGVNIKIALIDSGIEADHEDIKDGLLKVIDPTLGTQTHGTECAGIIGARQNGIGSIGVAPQSQLIFVGMNLNGSDEETISALQKAASEGAYIINNSWGSYHVSDAVKTAINDLATTGRNGKGVVIIFANGNDSRNLDDSEYDDESEISTVIGVGASSSKNTLSSYSNYGSNIDIVAPGGDESIGIVAPTSGNKYTDFAKLSYSDNIIQGTSFSAPIVAGVAGLILSINPNLTAVDVQNIIQNSATKIGTTTYTNGKNIYYGYGKINANEAVKLAKDTL